MSNDVVKFQHGNVYRGKAVGWKLDRTRAEGGSHLVEVMIEVTLGPMLGRRIRWTGFVTDEAIERTVSELNAMGWRAVEFGRWDGLGSKEVEFTVMADRKDARTYYRAAFVRPLAELTVRNEVTPEVASKLTARYADVLRPRAAVASAPPSSASEEDSSGFPEETSEEVETSF